MVLDTNAPIDARDDGEVSAGRLAQVRAHYVEAATLYRMVASRLGRLAPLASDGRLDEGCRQVMGIVLATCAPMLVSGADAMTSAVGRVDAALEERRGAGDDDRCASEEDIPSVPGQPYAQGQCQKDGPEGAPVDLADGARTLLWAAHSVDATVARFDREIFDPPMRRIVGDTHLYADTMRGICIPYLALAAEGVARAAGLVAPTGEDVTAC